MLNIFELERQWLRYKIRKAIPYLVFFVSIIVGVIIFLLWSNHLLEKKFPTRVDIVEVKEEIPYIEKKVDLVKAVEVEKAVVKTIVLEAEIVPKKESPSPKSKIEKTTLKPSFGFLEKMESIDKIDNQLKNQIITPKLPTILKTIEKPKPILLTDKEVIEPKPIFLAEKEEPKPILIPVKKVVEEKSKLIIPSRKSLTITRQSDNKDLRDVIKRFRTNKNPALGLFITKRFYALGNYQESYNYALITNEIDNEIEDSWIIFSKSLVKLGQKEMAISTLNSYILQSHSLKATLLLNEIEKGTFE